MKKLFSVFVCALLVTGCSFFEKQNKKTEPLPAPEQIEETMPRPSETAAEKETERTPIVTVDDFYFEAGEDGLILKNSLQPEYEQVLSENPILSAEIEDGILMYTEVTDNLEATKTVNLQAFVEYLNQE